MRTLVAIGFFLAIAAHAAIAPTASDSAAAGQQPAEAKSRRALFEASQRWCMDKFLSSAQLTAGILKAGGWSISHVCECASALTVSRMNVHQVASAGEPYNLSDWNAALSNNISTCARIQP